MLKGEVHQEDEEVYDMSGFGDSYNDEDEDETLSFCDLPIYNGHDDAQKETTDHASSRWKNQSSSYNENDDDCSDFSFSSSSSSSQSLQEKNIVIFCGKIIRPHRKEEALRNINSAYYFKELQLLKSRSSTPNPKGMSRTTEKKTCNARKNISSSATAKYNHKASKWYLLMMGLVRIHQGGKMELNDIKKRQTKKNHRRRSSSTTSGNMEFGDLEIVNNEMKGRDNTTGLLSLLRSFSCARTPTEDVDVEYCKVKASLWWLQQLRPAH